MSYVICLFLCLMSYVLCLMTQSHIKGGRSVCRRDIFDVSGKRYNYPLKTLSNSNFLCEEETYKNYKKADFWDFIPFDWLILCKIICFSAVKIERSFEEKKKYIFDYLQT